MLCRAITYLRAALLFGAVLGGGMPGRPRAVSVAGATRRYRGAGVVAVATPRSGSGAPTDGGALPDTERVDDPEGGDCPIPGR